MVARCSLLLAAAVVLCALGALPAAAVSFTGDVTADFVGPGIKTFDDKIGDEKKRDGLCLDEPLSSVNAFDGTPSIPDVPASGFNIGRVLWKYDCATDTLYIGLDVCDGKIPWDADGDGDILARSLDLLAKLGYENQPLLKLSFSDSSFESYVLQFYVDEDSVPDASVALTSPDGGATIAPPLVTAPPGISVVDYKTGLDVEFAVKGIRQTFEPILGKEVLAAKLITSSGSVADLSNEDVTEQTVSMVCPGICVEKEVSCSKEGPWAKSAKALRGSPVFFRIKVTNCGEDDLDDVVLTDVLTGAGFIGGIPSPQNLGTIKAGETVIQEPYQIDTAPDFDETGESIDFTNTVTVKGVGHISEVQVEDSDSADVNILVPSIICEKLADDDANFNYDDLDATPPTHDLDMTKPPYRDGASDVENVWFQISLMNNGEVDVDFGPGQNPECPDFWDPFLSTEDPLIPGTGVDIDAAFRSEIYNKFGGTVLPAGQHVSLLFPLTLDEAALCEARRVVFLNEFKACGIATQSDICLPPGGGEPVRTECQANVRIFCESKGTTRTPGFWMTHPQALQFAINAMNTATSGAGYTFVNLFKTSTWPAPCAVIGDTTIPNINVPTCEGKLAWEIFKAVPGKQPTPNLHAAAILQFQLLAAICNELTLEAGGVVVNGETLSELVDKGLALTADCAISDDEIADAIAIGDKLDKANNDPFAHDQPLPDGFPQNPASPSFFVKLKCP